VKKDDNYEEYADAKRSGLLKKKNTKPIPIAKTPLDWQKWAYRALITAAGLYIANGLLKPFVGPPKVTDTPVIKPMVCEDKPPKIVFKDKIKWRNKIVFKDRIMYRDKLVYKPDLKCLQDLAIERLKTKNKKYMIWQHYYAPRLDGEYRRVLTL